MIPRVSCHTAALFLCGPDKSVSLGSVEISRLFEAHLAKCRTRQSSMPSPLLAFCGDDARAKEGEDAAAQGKRLARFLGEGQVLLRRSTANLTRARSTLCPTASSSITSPRCLTARLCRFWPSASGKCARAPPSAELKRKHFNSRIVLDRFAPRTLIVEQSLSRICVADNTL